MSSALHQQCLRHLKAESKSQPRDPGLTCKGFSKPAVFCEGLVSSVAKASFAKRQFGWRSTLTPWQSCARSGSELSVGEAQSGER
jgi:hypothetical protein